MSAATSAQIGFWKMHGAGNDFILVDDRERCFPEHDRAWIEQLCRRRTGIGAEGLILIQPSEKADFRMRFFNPDGREVEMCGNGARCVARLANVLGAAPDRMRIETMAGTLQADMQGRDIRLHMTPPLDLQTGRTLTIESQRLSFGSVNTGVPHVVVETEDLDTCRVPELGAAIRFHRVFRPDGTNANFVTVTGPRSLRIRTYERGVEAETLACGTGIVAGALVAARAGKVKPPVKVSPASGDTLTVDFTDAMDRVTLLGPAAFVFQGTLGGPAGS